MTSDQNPPLDYLEFTSPEMEKTQAFFTEAFGWTYIDYGPDYKDIQGAGLSGGVERGPLRAPLPVLRAGDLDAMMVRVKAAGGTITKAIFDFPGGRRFQFREPGGTEMAVWSVGGEVDHG